MNDLLSAGAALPARRAAPVAFVRRREPRPSPVFESYWRFAAERQAIFHRRLRGEHGPWTDDPVLQIFKFTNPYRAADRVSQYLIRNVIYGGSFDLRSTVLRTLLFKLFNKIETWELLEHAFGEVSEAAFNLDAYSRALSHAMEGGAAIYSAAYIMPSGPVAVRRSCKHEMHLMLLKRLMVQSFPERLASCPTMEAGYNLLRSLPGIGPFLAYQFVTDLNYSPYLQFTELEFVMPGPGARDGIRKCFEDLGDYSEAEVIRWVTERQRTEFKSRDLAFQSLWGRDLQLIDCQNIFCEVDKYARVVHPDVQGHTGRTRIKQKFWPRASPLVPPWFPPKWGLNDAVAASLSQPPDRGGYRSASESQRSA